MIHWGDSRRQSGVSSRVEYNILCLLNSIISFFNNFIFIEKRLRGEKDLKFYAIRFLSLSLVVISILIYIFFLDQGKHLVFAQDNLTQIIPDHPPDRPFELTLRKALKIALRTYPGLGAAQQGVLASKAGIGVAQSQYYPTLSGSSTYTRETGNFGPQPGFPFTIPASPVSYDFYQAQLTLSETLFSFGRRLSQVRQNKHLFNASRSQYSRTLQDTVLNVEKAFFAVLKDQKLIHVDNLTIADYKIQENVAEIRYKDGVATSYDVMNARVNLSNALLTKVTDSNQLRVDRLSLDRAMGVISNSPYRVVPLPTLPVPSLLPDNAVALALHNRPDLAQITQQALAQKQVVKFNQAQFFPTVQMVGAYSFDSEFFPLVYNWSAAATVTVPIFNGFQFVHQVQQSRAQMKQTLFQREDLRQQTIIEVKADIYNIRTYLQKISQDKELVKQAEQNLYLVENQFRVGTGTSVAVTQAARDLTAARATYVRDQADLGVAISQLKHDEGINLDPVTHHLPPKDLP